MLFFADAYGAIIIFASALSSHADAAIRHRLAAAMPRYYATAMFYCYADAMLMRCVERADGAATIISPYDVSLSATPALPTPCRGYE